MMAAAAAAAAAASTMTPAEATALQTLDGALLSKVTELGLSGASVALYRPGYERPLLRGFGSMTPDSAIMIASVSKVFVGGAAAKIFELGLADRHRGPR